MLVSVEVRTEGSNFQVGAPIRRFSVRDALGGTGDPVRGERILLVKPVEWERGGQISLVVNWTAAGEGE